MSVWRWWRLLAWTPLVSKIRETKEPRLRCEENGRSATKASHAGIIRIGFEGVSQPHIWWSTPVSIIQLKHFGHVGGKCGRLTERFRHFSDYR